jgi:hypothetical protein
MFRPRILAGIAAVVCTTVIAVDVARVIATPSVEVGVKIAFRLSPCEAELPFISIRYCE